jgi:hypothetical protein
MLMSQRAMAESAERAPVPSEALGAYHLYTLPQPVDLPDGRTVQRALFQAPGVAVTPALELRGGGGAYTGRARAEAQPLAVTRLLELVNSEASGLGRPLPAGILRVYGTDGGGQIQFLGEDRIGHTPADTDLALNLGRAFDVTAERVQTQFAQRPALAPHNRVYESTHRILLRNAGSRPARVRVIENLPGEWEIVESTQRHSRTSAAAAEWLIEVPASGERALEFSARVRL